MDGLQLVEAPAATVSTVADATIRHDVNIADMGIKNEAKSIEMNMGKRKRGRPPKVQGNTAPAQQPRQREMEDEEDVCFVCFDGGDLVLCDRRGCPKAYHPACIKRDMSFFQSKAKWSCAWHFCNNCQKASQYMCYTCTYSLCKRCIEGADYVCVQGNKGFCPTCMKTIMLIENIPVDTGEKVQVDFDDTTSWEYLFKIYWTSLKTKFSLTVDELTKANILWKGDDLPTAKISCGGVGNLIPKQDLSRELYRCNEKVSSSNNSCGSAGTNSGGSKIQNLPNDLDKKNCLSIEESAVGKVAPLSEDLEGTTWATKELLEFVAHMRNGDKSILTQFHVQGLLLEYIKRNNLRNPRRKCEIVCDQRLMNLFGKTCVGHFEMLKLLESHFLVKEKSSAHSTITGITDAVGGQAEADKAWQYQDPSGKIQGPFSLIQLCKWSNIGLFPSDMRVWNINEKQSDSILLTDALSGKWYKKQNSPCLSLFPQEVISTSDYAHSKCDSVFSPRKEATCSNDGKVGDNQKLMQNDASVCSSSNSELSRSNGRFPLSSSPVRVDASITRDEQAPGALQVPELSNRTKSLADQQNICGSLPSPLSSVKLPEIPFLKVKDGHGNENMASHEELTPCSPRSTKGLGNFQRCDEKKGRSSIKGNSSVSEQKQPGTVPKRGQANSKGQAKSKGQANETKHADSPKALALDLGPSWSTSSSLVVEKARAEVASEWGGCSHKAARGPAENWDSNVVSTSLAKPTEGSNDHVATPTSGSSHLTYSSALHPLFDTSSWQMVAPEPSEFCSLAGESVSDLLAQVEAMESCGNLPTPTSKLSSRGELTQGADSDYFSPFEGFSPVLDHGKNDALRFGNDIPKSAQLNVAEERLELSNMPSSRPIVTAEPLGVSQVSLELTIANEPLQVSNRSSQSAITDEGFKGFSGHFSTSTMVGVDAKPNYALADNCERRSEAQPPAFPTFSRGRPCSNIQPPASSTFCSSQAVSNIHFPTSFALSGNQGTAMGFAKFNRGVGQWSTNTGSGTDHVVVQQHANTNLVNRNQASWGSQPSDKFSGSRDQHNYFPGIDSSGNQASQGSQPIDRFADLRDQHNYFPGRDLSIGRDRSSRNRQSFFALGKGGTFRPPPKR